VNEWTDQELLRDYAERRSEAAFSELVRRHVDLVYSAARRMVCETHLAQDVTQNTFVALAQNARQLTDRPVLSGWLHRTAQNLASKTVRTDVRRRAREEEAATMNELLAESGTDVPPDWAEIAPHLDAALGELNESDREALMLRYFERKSAREMAQTLGISDEAAQKRVSRAVERLRELIGKCGVTVGAGGLVVAISANAVEAAPIGLATTISTAAALAGTAAQTSTVIAATKTLAMTTLQKTVLVAAFAAAVSLGMYEAHRASTLGARIKTLQLETKPSPDPSGDAALSALQEKIQVLTTQNGDLTSALARANADKARLEKEREQARHSAAVFKELADQANRTDKDSTNAYPTPRHVWAGFGRLARLSAQLAKDDSKLSPEEKSANEAARLNAFGEMGDLMRAIKQLEADKSSESGDLADDPLDSVACVLYGALNLNEQQFGQVYGLLEKYGQQAKQNNLSEDNHDSESAAALKQLMEQAKAEIQSLLTPEQASALENVLPYIQMSPGKFNVNVKFDRK
jgi:RNA polymerase sigma factor (sigma-70 family)